MQGLYFMFCGLIDHFYATQLTVKSITNLLLFTVNVHGLGQGGEKIFAQCGNPVIRQNDDTGIFRKPSLEIFHLSN